MCQYPNCISRGLADGFIRGLPARRIGSMSIVDCKVIGRLPKPLLLALLFFPMAAVCGA